MTLPDEVAIVVSDLGKRYEIYGRPHHRLLQTLLRGRRRFYREFWALRDVSLTVRRGETFGIVGPNGSGKSTLLQLVAGTLAPTLGSVTTHGRVAALLELGSGFNPEFTGRENVYLNGAILGIPRHEMKRAFTAIEAFAGIGDFIDQPVKTYSSGMVVRLAFAVAVHVTPDILIVDEALAVGDTAFQAKCLDRIRAMQRTGVAILLVSHSLNTVIEFCDRAVYLDAGRLVAIGGCRQVVQRYSDDVTQTEARSALLSQALRQEVHAPRTAPETHASLMAQAVDNASAEPALPSTQILSVTVTDAQGVPKAAFAHGDEILIAIDLMFHRSNPAPCFGIQLKSTDDISLWAVTTASLDIRPPPVDAGTRLTFIWSLRATLGGSRFVVALGVGDNAAGEYRRHDRLPYAVHFDVLPEPRGGAGWLGVSATFVDPRRPTGEAAPETAGKGSKGVTARRPSILVVMADNRRLQCRLDEADYNSMTAAINKSYCDRMGYDFSYYRVFYMDRASDDILNCKDPHSASMRHASWSKLLALQHALLTTDHDYCCYIDSDAAFINWGRRIEGLIGHTEITFQNNQPFTAGPCAGFFIIKRSLLTLRFLERWYFTDAGDKNTKRTWEQSVLLPLLESGGYPYSIASELAFSDQEGQLVRHITAVGSENLRRPYFSNVIRQENIDYRLAIQEISVIDFDSSTELSSLRQA